MCDPATPLDSSSDSTCSCCTSVPESGYPPAPAIQEISTLVGLEGRFLARLKFQSITPFYVQAMAIVPTDPRTAGNWPLIQLLSHRIFSTLQDQRRLRRLSMFCYEHFGPGDVLLIAARPVTQNALKWLEADITRDGALVATVKALFDGRSVEDDGVGSESSNGLVSDFDKLTTIPSDI